MDENEEKVVDEIILDKEERYDANKLDCWAFSKGTDIKNGIPLKFGNMLGGFPIVVDGITYPCSEVLYLSGQFSNNTPAHRQVRETLLQQTNGFAAKKSIKNRSKSLIREDFSKFATQWMFWIVWQKTLQNNAFQQILKSIPSSAIIIEDSSWQTSKTAMVWGCKNKELRRVQTVRKKELKAQYTGITKKKLNEIIDSELLKIGNVGVYIGQNNLGKILMLCKLALDNNTVPSIDYDVLKQSLIYLSGDQPLFANI